MKRRTFLALSALLPLYNIKLQAKEVLPKQWVIIDAVYQVLFIETDTMPSASTFKASEYLIKNIHHKTFSQEDKEFILQGALDFQTAFPKFLKTKDKKEIIISAQKNDYGNEWLTKLIEYGFEAMFSDPIYGGNKHNLVWKAVNHTPGFPQPKRKYGERA